MKRQLIRRMLAISLAASMILGNACILHAAGQDSGGETQTEAAAEPPAEEKRPEESGNVLLTDLEMLESENGYNDIRTDGRSAGGTLITLWNGEEAVEYGRGIGMHSFNDATVARAVYDISGYSHNVFRATAGVDYLCGTSSNRVGTCEFWILIDGETVYSSGIMRSTDPAADIMVLIPEGAETLTLAVVNGGDGNNSDWADWVDPRLESVEDAEHLFASFSAVAGREILNAGDQDRITAAGSYLNGEAIENMTQYCRFQSSDSEVVRVDDGGEITAVGAGEADITVTGQIGDTVRRAVISVKVLAGLQEEWSVRSPSGNIEFVLGLDVTGSLRYYALSDGKTAVQPSSLGLETTVGSFTDGLTFVAADSRVINETYPMISGKKSEYVNHCTETTFVFSKEGTDAKFEVVARAYDDGVAYRYCIEGNGSLEIVSEDSGFTVPGGSRITALPYGAAGNCYEDAYENSTADSIDGQMYNMPFLYRTADDEWVLITEAALSTEYTGSVLTGEGRELKFAFTPSQNANVVTTAPWESPWRTAIIGGGKEIVENTMAENLSPACKIEDTSWIRPATTSWTWYVSPGFAAQNNPDLIKEYIDVAAEFGWKYYLMDEGWQGGQQYGNDEGLRWEGIPDWLPEIVEYGREKGVGIMAWIASEDLNTPEKREFIKELSDLGVVGLKIDFFNDESQKAMKLYEDIYETCAENRMMVDIHGCNKPTGEIRTWPNLLTREGIRAQEYNETIAARDVMLVYTRTAVGPADFNPNVDLLSGGDVTAGHKVALNILYETGLPCPSDRAETYRRLNLMTLMKELPASWDETRYVEGDPESYATLARRDGENWYVASICTAERQAQLSLDFLDDGTYTAYLYRDGESRWDIDFEIQEVTNQDTLTIPMKENGGYTVKIVKGEAAVPADVELSETEVSLVQDTVHTLTASVIPEESADIARVEWVSSNDEIASVSASGAVTGHKVGTAYITAKVTTPLDGGETLCSRPCKVTVTPAEYQLTSDWTRESPDPKWSVNSETSITLHPLQGEIATDGNTAKNIITLTEQNAGEDFEAVVQCDFAPESSFQTAGITVMDEESHYVGVWKRYHQNFGGNIFESIKCDGSYNEQTAADGNPEQRVWLKLKKEGTTYIGSYSYDGREWTEIGRQQYEWAEDEQICIAVMCFAGRYASDSDMPAVFTDFTYNGEVIPFAEKTDTAEITEIISPDDMEVTPGTEAEELNLPPYVTVRLADGTETDTAVTWDLSQYRSDREGICTITGVPEATEGLANSAGIQASVNVTVKLPYVDVGPDDYFYEAAVSLYEKEIMTGMDETHFEPVTQLARAHFVTILYRMAGSPETDGKTDFADVPGGEWFSDAVAWAAENGIVTGYSSGYFGPADPVTREQIAAMLYRYNGQAETAARSTVLDYPDAMQISDFAREAMAWAVSREIIRGQNNGTILAPQNYACRAEAATMIARYLG